MARPFQFGLSDILLLTAIVAALVATIASRQATIAFITQGILLMFVWHRPVVLRLWVTGTMGLGCGLLVAMLFRGKVDPLYFRDFGMYVQDVAGWGAGMIGGGLAAWRLFIANPPVRHEANQTATPPESKAS